MLCITSIWVLDTSNPNQPNPPLAKKTKSAKSSPSPDFWLIVSIFSTEIVQNPFKTIHENSKKIYPLFQPHLTNVLCTNVRLMPRCALDKGLHWVVLVWRMLAEKTMLAGSVFAGSVASKDNQCSWMRWTVPLCRHPKSPSLTLCATAATH